MKDSRRVKIEDGDSFNISLCLDISDHNDENKTKKTDSIKFEV